MSTGSSFDSSYQLARGAQEFRHGPISDAKPCLASLRRVQELPQEKGSNEVECGAWRMFMRPAIMKKEGELI